MRTCPRVRHAHVWVHACKLARRREKSTKKIAAPRKLPPFFSSLFLFFLFIIRVFLRSRRFRDEKRDFEQVFDSIYFIWFSFISILTYFLPIRWIIFFWKLVFIFCLLKEATRLFGSGEWFWKKRGLLNGWDNLGYFLKLFRSVCWSKEVVRFRNVRDNRKKKFRKIVQGSGFCIASKGRDVIQSWKV